MRSGRKCVGLLGGALLLAAGALSLTDTGSRIFWVVSLTIYDQLAEWGTVLTVGSP